MDDTTQNRLLEEFKQYLETLDSLDVEGGGETDQVSLFTELAALRTEVKAESRLFRGAMEELKEVQGWLKDSQSNLDHELERFRGEFPALRRSALRPVLLDLLDLHDRLSAGFRALENYRPVKGWFRTKSRKEDRRFIQSLLEGQGMTLRRLEEMLARQQVRPIEAVGRMADPHTMKVVELDHQPKLENGVVTGELRKGFFWGDEVLRLSEVKANKL